MSKEMRSTPESPQDPWISIQRSIIEMAVPEQSDEKRLEWTNLHAARCRELWDQYQDADPKPTPEEIAGMILQTIQEEESTRKMRA